MVKYINIIINNFNKPSNYIITNLFAFQKTSYILDIYLAKILVLLNFNKFIKFSNISLNLFNYNNIYIIYICIFVYLVYIIIEIFLICLITIHIFLKNIKIL